MRWGRAGEQLKLLNGQTVEVDERRRRDHRRRGRGGLAGIMGGDATAVSLDTRNIYLEAAFWWPDAIARARAPLQLLDRCRAPLRARRRLRHDGRPHRVHHAPDPRHLRRRSRARSTTPSLAPARAQAGDDAHRARRAGASASPIADDDMADAFARLGLRVRRATPDRFVVTPPSYRFDLEIEEDLIEEVARALRLRAHPGRPAARRGADADAARGPALRCTTSGARSPRDGYQEVVNYRFVDAALGAGLRGQRRPDPLLNPIASQMSVMRTTLLGGLVANAALQPEPQAGPRARCSRSAACSCATPQVPDGPLAVQGIAQPTRGRRPRLRPGGGRAVGRGDPRRRLLRRQGRRRARCSRRVAVRFDRAEHPALHPGRSALRRGRRRGRRLRRRTASAAAAEVRVAAGRRSCSNWMLAPLLARAVAPLQPGLEVPAGDARHLDHRRRRPSGRGDRGRGARRCRTRTAACRRSGNSACSTCIVLEAIQAKSRKRVLTPC